VLFLRAQMPGLGNQSRLALGFFTISLLLGWPTAAVISARETPTSSAGAGELVNALVLSLPRGATVLAAEDNLLGVMTYAQKVQGLRPDVNVIAPGALRYPFYRAQVRACMPEHRRTHWLSLEVWDSDEWNELVREWITQRPSDERLFTQYDAIPGLDPRLLTPAGYLYGVSPEPTQIPWTQAAEFWRTAPKSATRDPLARAVMARWTFNFGSFAILRGKDAIGWDALRAAVHLEPDDPEIYYLLGNALGRAGRAGDARAMFAAAVELAPYRLRYREALGRYTEARAEKP
jgi:tetratricopeptide (TPR) repeat protein